MFINCHTHYSLRYGALSETDLLQLAQQNGYTRIALTDINNTSACLNFIRLAPKYAIQAVVGIDFRNGVRQEFVGLAQNNHGFQELNQFLSQHKHHNLELPNSPPPLADTFIIYPFHKWDTGLITHLNANEYIGIDIRDFNRLQTSTLLKQPDKIVLLRSVTFRNKQDYHTHCLMRAIDKNTLLSKLDKRELASPHQYMLSPTDLQQHFKELSFVLKNTEQLLERCNIHFAFGTDNESQNSKTYTGSETEDWKLITQLCEEGLAYRYSEVTTTIQKRLEKELSLIKKMGFVPFFLINCDIVKYARYRNYYYVGRGSGANSIVAYLLRITDVDPIDLDLYFERFINLYRANPPDFDIDFSWRDREDVTRYIFDRFGENNQAALLATYNTFQHSGAVRELGKVFGLPKHEIDLLSSGKFAPRGIDQLSQRVLKYSSYLRGKPNHLSIHAGGILISERSMHYFSATDLPPKGFPTVQFDMIIAEDVGLCKFDILGQRGLGKIKDAISIVQQNQPEVQLPDIHNVNNFIHDPKINKMVSEAKCIGCFYVESPAMRMLLRKLEVDNYLGLVAASSIIRPGVAKSGMMREYILRHKNPERIKQAHPVMLKLMQDTYGVMVYQEDVIKVAHYFAGLSLGEADVLRRGMSGKFRSREEFQRVKEKFTANCREKGYPDAMTREVWKQIESFAGYAFAKGHSASYAVESYQSLFLKAYYPLEFMVAVLNNGGGFYRSEFYIHEARKHGGQINAPCINKSHYETSISGKQIYLGFQLIKGLDHSLIQRIVEQRKTHGCYSSFQDFLEHIPLGIEQLELLIRIGAFRFTKQDKPTLLWQAYFRLNKSKLSNNQQLLFKSQQKNLSLPHFSIHQLEDAFDELELFGFPLRNPFELMAEQPKHQFTTRDFPKNINRQVEIYGYLVCTKSTTTSRGDRMFFGTFLDQNGDWIDTVHFPPVAARYPFRGRSVYKLWGQVVDEFDFLTLEIKGMKKINFVQDPRFVVDEVNQHPRSISKLSASNHS